MSASVTFKAKAIEHTVITDNGDIITGLAVKVPKLTSRHCDMHAMRTDSKTLSKFANSTLFDAALNREAKKQGVHRWILIETPPAGVTITPGFMTAVTFTVE